MKMIRITYTNNKPNHILFGLLWILFTLLGTQSEVVSWSLKSSQLKSVENRDTLYQRFDKDCTEIAPDKETLIVFSTLGGGLTAIDPITRQIRWTIADDPPVKTQQQQNVGVPQYLPDPRDGSIYQLGDMGNLKKLPYTIQQLVANAPCRSPDGILYSGKKNDMWFIVDPKTGQREKIDFGESIENRDDINSQGERIGWATTRAIYLGRTQYTVMMYDSLAKGKNVKPWNITFYDYSAMATTPDITQDYEYLHLTTTTNGNLLTLNRKDGKFLWKNDLPSPVVAAFLLSHDGLLSVPFTTVSLEAFEAILQESKEGNVNTIKLFQSLYVGENEHGLYALPSLVNKNTPIISSSRAIKLLDGPHSLHVNGEMIDTQAGIILGHYNFPRDMNLPDSSSVSTSNNKKNNNRDLVAINSIMTESSSMNVLLPTTETKNNIHTMDTAVQTESDLLGLEIETNITYSQKQTILEIFLETSKYFFSIKAREIYRFIREWFMEHPSRQIHQILAVVIIMMAVMFWYICSVSRELKNSSDSGSRTLSSNEANATSRRNSKDSSNNIYQELIDLGDGHIQVGKITFNSNQVLGKGCEGTFVFKGSFEKRSVAVKRLLPDCFTFADREVALLRESDAHENVVRYFCTEEDRQFRYIAVELCAATLQDYTEGELSTDLRSLISVWDVMKQSASGLSHLHSLCIVHRDIKPQNVLLSLPDINGHVRVMISDFGLCKKLNYGKMSFSRRSGITGTDGWIAPEMMCGQRTTTSVDIFSLGCVYYYILSGGQHAFGEALKRQANILSNECKMNHLKASSSKEEYKILLVEQLIVDMINSDPQKRPPASCIGEHPVFWKTSKVLSFLQDVSDRVEKLQFSMEPLLSLEKNSHAVVLGDWNDHLDPLLREDLRKFRGYTGTSVRDLLRALRNKKHHYHELSSEMQQLLGSIPSDFTKYWLSRFPLLLSHSYHAFSMCAQEPIFSSYYKVNATYSFTRPDYFDTLDDRTVTLRLRNIVANSNVRSSTNHTTANQSPRKSYYTAKQRKGAYNFRKVNSEVNQ